MPTNQISYSSKPGKANPSAVIAAVKAAVEENGIRHVAVASTSGATALAFAKALGKKAQVIAVTYHAGWHGGDVVAMKPEARRELEKAGVLVVMCSHALSGISRSVSRQFGGPNYPELIAATFKMLGEGMKVAVEVSVMAADSGQVPTDQNIIAVGGTGSGCDTAIVLRTAHQNNFFTLRVHEILAMVSGS
jgi:uncharacterized protein